MSIIKEPCFLAPDFQSINYPQTEDEYLKCFEKPNGQKYIGEATSTYLYSQKAAQTIHDYSSDAKIIAMLRNPVQLVASLHAQRLKEGDENLRDLKDALDAEEARRHGKNIPLRFVYPYQYLLYRDYGQYSSQLKRYFNTFGRENVHVIIFDDFAANSQESVAGVCRFLGLSNLENIDAKTHNPAQLPRFLFIHRTIVVLTRVIMFMGHRFKAYLPKLVVKTLWGSYVKTTSFIRRKNLVQGRQELKDSVKRELSEHFKTEIEQLEQLLDRDLSIWKSANAS